MVVGSDVPHALGVGGVEWRKNLPDESDKQ